MASSMDVQASIERATEVLHSHSGLTWGASVRAVNDGRQLACLRADETLSTASIGKLLLLVESAERLRLDPRWGKQMLRRMPVDDVADSGIWRHLATDTLPVVDVAVLVAAHSDNLATNVLLREVGLDAVHRRAAALGMQSTTLLDKVRDERGPPDPSQLSVGTAGELSRLAVSLQSPGQMHEATRNQVVRWLRTGADLSMVAASLGLDPLSHSTPDRGWMVWNKTGRDAGVLADVGVLHRETGALAFAVIANWDPHAEDADVVLDTMRRFGAMLATALRAGVY